jgi:uncharacterized repeat protein (TIGR03803 family)
MTEQGGTSGLGVLFEYDPAGAGTFTKKVDFDGTAKGSYPQGSLIVSGGKLYGMTTSGGTSDLGVLFEYDPAGAGTFTKKVDFDGTAKGSYPAGSLIVLGGKLYGMTADGGTGFSGVLFEYDLAGAGTFTKKVDFDGTAKGRNPRGSLMVSGGKLYGMTYLGGTMDIGVLFEYDPAGAGTFTKKVDFDGTAKGSNPSFGNLVEYTASPSTLQYRTAGAVTFASATNWESSPDGTAWSAAASAPDATASTLAITIRNGHTATVTASITRDQLTVEAGGTLVVNGGVQFTVADGIGDDLTINGTLDVQGSNGVVDCAGQFVLKAGAKLITANENGITGGAVIDTGGLGTFTWEDGADYTLNGTIPQTANLPIVASIQNIEINNTMGVAEGQALAFALSGTLTLTAGAFDISGAGVSIDFSGATPITRTAGNIITDANSALTFSGTGASFTLPNDLFSTSPFTVGAFVVTRTQNLSLGNQSLNVNNIVSISNTGKLNLNGNNIVLLAGATLTEDLNPSVNGVVYDATATSYTTPGGYIEVPAANIPGFAAGYTPIAGIGLEIGGATTVITNVRRYHYPPTTGGGTGFSKGIRRVFAITGTAANGVTDIKINYASSELNGISDATPANMYISRWSAGTGWQSFQHDGTNVIFTAGSIEMKDITTGFSTWTMSGSPAPLPITLTGLKGERVEGQNGEMTEEVKLTWKTASEINNKGFEVEMSENGLAYQKIAFVEGRGSSNTPIDYQLTTINQKDGYYRLRQIDFDGKYSYSPVVFVEGVNITKVYPNPNNGTFTISVGKEDLDLPARLLNAKGVESPLTSEGGTYRVGKDLPSGVYFLHTTVAGKAKVTKIVVSR